MILIARRAFAALAARSGATERVSVRTDLRRLGLPRYLVRAARTDLALKPRHLEQRNSSDPNLRDCPIGGLVPTLGSPSIGSTVNFTSTGVLFAAPSGCARRASRDNICFAFLK